MLDASKENCIHIPTGGTISDNQYRLLLFNLHLQPLTLAHVTVPKAPITQLSKRIRKRHVLELQRTRNILSGGSDDSGILFEDEVRALSADQRQQLLHSAGIKLNIEPTQGLAIKSMIGLPWYRLRTLSRWLKHSGVSFGSERKHRALCRELIGDNLEVELAPFSFKLADGGEEIRGAAHAYTPSLTAMITQLLEQNEMYDKSGDYDFLCLMYGTSGASGKHPCLWCLVTLDQLQTSSPTSRLCARRSLETMLADYQWFIASGGDIKNAKYYNNCINEPFFKIPLSQVCVPGLHITQGIFLKLFSMFEEACHRIDLKLALYCPTAPLSRSQFDEYSKALKDLSEIISKLETVHLEEETFQQLATYCSISAGNFTPFIGSLLEHWHERRKVLENQRNLITETVNKGFKMDDGPCIKRVQSCLDSFGVCRQRYYGGIFVGNHVHIILKPSNIEELCSCILTATANSPELNDEAEAVHARFLTLLKQFSECHSLYDCNATTPDKVQHLDHTIKSFFATFDKEFQGVGRTVKMHILECHTVEWLSLHQAGCGLMGEVCTCANQGPNVTRGSGTLGLRLGRKLRATLPVTASQLKPRIIPSEVVQRTLVQKRSTQKWKHDKGAKPLSELEKGDEAYMQVSNKWLPVVVTDVTKTPRSCVVKRPDGRKYRRNCKHLRAKYQVRNNHYNATKTQGETSKGGKGDGMVQNKDLQQATPTEEGTDVGGDVQPEHEITQNEDQQQESLTEEDIMWQVKGSQCLKIKKHRPESVVNKELRIAYIALFFVISALGAWPPLRSPRATHAPKHSGHLDLDVVETGEGEAEAVGAAEESGSCGRTGTDIFIQIPVNTSALEGSTTRFGCTTVGTVAVTYLVNSMSIAEVASIGVTLSPPVYNGSETSVYLYVPAINNTTGWQVVCSALLPNETRVVSPPAYLHVQVIHIYCPNNGSHYGLVLHRLFHVALFLLLHILVLYLSHLVLYLLVLVVCHLGLVLDVAKVVLDVAKVVLDVGKVVLDVAKVVLDVGKVVLDVAKVVLDVAKVVLDVAKVVLDVAKVVLDVGKVVLDMGKVVLDGVQHCHYLCHLPITTAF
eukprot:Em0012g95a